jgi:putative endonuclease
MQLIFTKVWLTKFWSTDRRVSEWRGHAAEVIAAVFLMLKGYRILARRCRTRSGEIDLIAKRGATLMFIEVKQRRTRELAASAITRQQSQRLRRAAELWIADKTRYHHFERRYDAVFITPHQWPSHVPAGA